MSWTKDQQSQYTSKNLKSQQAQQVNLSRKPAVTGGWQLRFGITVETLLQFPEDDKNYDMSSD